MARPTQSSIVNLNDVEKSCIISHHRTSQDIILQSSSQSAWIVFGWYLLVLSCMTFIPCCSTLIWVRPNHLKPWLLVEETETTKQYSDLHAGRQQMKTDGHFLVCLGCDCPFGSSLLVQWSCCQICNHQSSFYTPVFLHACLAGWLMLNLFYEEKKQSSCLKN